MRTQGWALHADIVHYLSAHDGTRVIRPHVQICRYLVDVGIGSRITQKGHLPTFKVKKIVN